MVAGPRPADAGLSHAPDGPAPRVAVGDSAHCTAASARARRTTSLLEETDMEITRTGNTAAGPAAWFTGAVFIDTVATPAAGARISASNVHFTPGARTAWHSHPRGQSLWVMEGVGLV